MRSEADFVAESLQTDIRMLTETYSLARTAEWTSIVKVLVAAERVSVASFHMGRFIGQGFADLLQHVKPRTRFADGADGAYADMLLDAAQGQLRGADRFPSLREALPRARRGGAPRAGFRW